MVHVPSGLLTNDELDEKKEYVNDKKDRDSRRPRNGHNEYVEGGVGKEKKSGCAPSWAG
jgi:hypothetical protein